MKWQQTYKQASYQQSSLSMIKVCFLNAIQWLDFIRVSSAVSPDVLLGVVQLCSLVLASPGSDGDIVSALWVYIRHYGDQRPVSGSVTLRCKMGHSVATCKYQDTARCCRVSRSGGDIVAFGSKLNTRWKAPILPIVDSHIIPVPHFSTYKNPYFSLPLGKSTECPPMLSCNNLHSWCGCW